jgi:predicted KAP-like P-loop ATPase
MNSGFAPDRPIESAEEDLLGRSSFASLLAENISEWRGHESLVIALYGGWGSGKSSVKNLVVEKLKEQKDKPITHVEFNPWLVSGEEKITASFFAEIGAKLSLDTKDEASTRRAAAWKRYARYFELGSNLFDILNIPASAFGIPVLGPIGKILGKGKDVAKAREEALNKKERSLQELRLDLRKEFFGLTAPVLVVIDDIDRLTEDEISLVFRLVKANADFPNLIFLLLFQRETAESALDKISGNQGRLFLEKIVQVGIDLPPPGSVVLADLLFRRINRILEPLVREADLENERFSNIWVPGLSQYFRNLREIYRFLSSFSYAVNAFTRGGILEVNPVDLIAIETLRISEPKVYEIIRQNKSILLDYSSRGDKEERAELAKAMLAKSDRHKGALQSILKQLFPLLQEVWENYSYSGEFRPIWVRARRICTERFFDRYFLLGVPSDQVSEVTIDQILTVSSDRAELHKIFEDLRMRGLALDALERLEAEERLTTLLDPFPYIVTLADVCDFLPRRRVVFFSLHADVYARSALVRALNRIQDEEKKRQLVTRLIEESRGLCAAAIWIHRVEKPEPDSLLPQLSSEECNRLKQVWLARVRTSAESGYLYKVQELFTVLWSWREWAGTEEPKEWTLAIVRGDGEAITLLRAFISESSSTSLGSYHSRDESLIDPKTLEDFCPFPEWEKLESRLNAQEGLNSEEQRVVNLFKRGMEKWRTNIAHGHSNNASSESKD